MVKGKIDKKLGQRWQEKAMRIIQKCDKIYVFGASLGDTDEFWWESLAQWFEASPERHQLAFYCHPDSNKVKMQEKAKIFVDNVSTQFKDNRYQEEIAVETTQKEMTVKNLGPAENFV